MDTEMIDKLFLELSQFTTAKTNRQLELERLLKRSAESHASIALVLRDGATVLGMQSCIAQCDQCCSEANAALRIKPERTLEDRDDEDIHGY